MFNNQPNQNQAPQSKSPNLSLSETTLNGEVLRIVYSSEDGTYTVIKLRQKKQDLPVIGFLPDIVPGQEVEIQGKWESHKEHGRQFHATGYKAILPTSEKGIRRFLGSGLIPGIGPKYAEMIVDKFGTDTIKILNNFSGRLKEIPGFGQKRITQIKEAWEAHGSRREIYMYLQSFGISTTFCSRIYNKYGNAAAQIVKQNPYRLASDIHGIGFRKADEVALAQGIAIDAPPRICAGIAFTLKELAKKGHVYSPADQLIAYSAELLRVAQELVFNNMSEALSTGAIIADPLGCHPGQERIYLKNLFKNETGLAEKIRYLLDFPIKTKGKGKPLPYSTHLTTTQAHAVTTVFESGLSIITGGPGVGKTTVIAEIVRQAIARKLRIKLAAPTGRAAKRMSESCKMTASTIHRLLKWDPSENSFVFCADKQLACDLLIVDEISMLDTNLAYHLFAAVPETCMVVLVGDKDQLPSVGPGAVLHDLLNCGRIPVTQLLEIFRQGPDSHIITNAHMVNSGKIPNTSRPAQNATTDFYWIEQENLEKVNENIIEMITNRIPQRFKFNPQEDIQVLVPMHKGECGAQNLNQLIQHALNSPGRKRDGNDKGEFKSGDRTFRENDKVMQTSNNYEKKVFNGDIGRIRLVDMRNKKFYIRFEEDEVEFEFSEADQITHAYAITVHKSQGSEFPVVIMPLLTQHYVMLQKNLIYTGMTRAKKLLILVGTRRALEMAVRNNRQTTRYTHLQHRLRPN